MIVFDIIIGVIFRSGREILMRREVVKLLPFDLTKSELTWSRNCKRKKVEIFISMQGERGLVFEGNIG